MKKSVYLAVKLMNLIEFIWSDVTFVSAFITLWNVCIHKILLTSIIICWNHYRLLEKFFKTVIYIKIFYKSNFFKSLKIHKISYILNVYNVRRWYSSNKRETKLLFWRHFWQNGVIFTTREKVFSSTWNVQIC